MRVSSIFRAGVFSLFAATEGNSAFLSEQADNNKIATKDKINLFIFKKCVLELWFNCVCDG